MDLGYHSHNNSLDIRATKADIKDLHILTHNAKHVPAVAATPITGDSWLLALPDTVLTHILSFLPSDQLARCARVCRRLYPLAWDPALWRSVNLTGCDGVDADLALKTILRLLARTQAASPVEAMALGGCARLTDRGLAMVARRCPRLTHLEVQNCANVTNGGVMDLVTKCAALDHLDVTGEN